MTKPRKSPPAATSNHKGPHPPQKQLVVTAMEARRVVDPSTTEDFRLSGWHHGYGTVFVATHQGVMMSPEHYSVPEWATSARAVITRNRVGHLGAGLATARETWSSFDQVTSLVCREAWWSGFDEGAHQARRELQRGHRLKPELVAPDTRRSKKTLKQIANGMKKFFIGE